MAPSLIVGEDCKHNYFYINNTPLLLYLHNYVMLITFVDVIFYMMHTQINTHAACLFECPCKVNLCVYFKFLLFIYIYIFFVLASEQARVSLAQHVNVYTNVQYGVAIFTFFSLHIIK